jgi:hypothetical protein
VETTTLFTGHDMFHASIFMNQILMKHCSGVMNLPGHSRVAIHRRMKTNSRSQKVAPQNHQPSRNGELVTREWMQAQWLPGIEPEDHCGGEIS